MTEYCRLSNPLTPGLFGGFEAGSLVVMGSIRVNGLKKIVNCEVCGKFEGPQIL